MTTTRTLLEGAWERISKGRSWSEI